MKLGRSMGFNGALLAGFALLTALILASVNELTRAPIAQAERDSAQRALLEILPADSHDNSLIEDTLTLEPAWQVQLNNAGVIYRARRQGKVSAVIVPVDAPDGYSGKIKLIVGVRADKTLAGVRVLSHTETPGLGDKVDLKKSPWILSFNGTSLTAPAQQYWAVKKDGGQFDQFTGATITPRAVVRQVKNVLLFVEQHYTQLFEIDEAPAP